MKAVKNGSEVNVSWAKVGSVLQQVLPAWAIRGAIDHVHAMRNKDLTVDLDKIGGSETNYRIIDLDTALKLCNLSGADVNDPNTLQTIENTLDGHLQTHKHKEGIDFLITTE